MKEKISLTFSETALTDLERLLEYYKEQGSPDAGKRVVSQILAKAEKLTTHPEMGRAVPEFGLDRLRELIDPPFRIIYLREKGKVRIVRVWRSERLLGQEAIQHD
ncbi:MAG: type II toxin-antitoxin system RelE/ParE family toxin [Alphaproteobacteria bacterium]|uniref:Type II toxin-antitoxin system RelE/ParE family toxin n=1 Tax=Candidatus Nitrobium versatile TaxID=2884831 RepID=A0A953J9V7_9BACT|nr:type II toxin-antitoxin system RelE/ParE family toxin [Candidatus Nitrobium versatile]